MKMRPISPVILSLCLLVLPAVAQSNSDRDIKDSKIENAIEGELFGAKAVDANAIDVQCKQGIIKLTGEVDNLLTRQRAVRIARMTKGVRSVVDQMKVERTDVSDPQLRLDVITALASDPATESWEIKASADNGEVTLEGTVQSHAERELAGMVAKGVRGVRNLKNRIAVNSQSDRPEREIKAEVEQRLRWDVRLDDELINVEVNDGTVKLTGSAGSAFEKAIAASLSNVAGIDDVDTAGLDVQWWTRDDMQRDIAWKDLNDQQIREAVELALFYDPRVSSFRPEVDVDNGVVTLRGNVSNMKAKRSAARDADNTVGVGRVNNYLKVRPSNGRSDAEIRQDIVDAFRRDVLVSRLDATIDVDDGKVTLYGDVDSYFERSQMEDIVAKTRGVSDVNNLMSVSYDPVVGTNIYDWDPTLYDFDFDYQTTMQKPDAEILEKINSEIWWSPLVDASQVNVTVTDGVATLTGSVDSWSERDAAGSNALEGGAVKVVNRLSVDY